MTTPAPAGCPGKYLRVSGHSAGICYGCDRYGKPGEQIEPAAAMDDAGTWRCANLVSFGQTGTKLLDGEEDV